MIKDILANSQVRFDEQFVCSGGVKDCVIPHSPVFKDTNNVEDIKSFLLQEQIAVVRAVIEEVESLLGKRHNKKGKLFNLSEVRRDILIYQLEESIIDKQ